MEVRRLKRTILIVGATASMIQPLIRMLAKRGYELVLAGRNSQELGILCADTQLRYGTICRTLDADFLDSGFSAKTLLEQAGDITHLLLAGGDMGNGNIAGTADIAYTMHVNYTVNAQIAAAAAARMSEQGGGTIAIVSSVAGDRGRAKIASYGAAKAALTSFASALRQAYSRRGVHVLTIKPGFVDTPMTWNMRSPLIASREKAARKILRAIEKKKNVVYVPWFWRLIMLIIRHLPESMFKKLRF